MNVNSRICSDRMANQNWNCLAEEQKWSENGQWPAVILHTDIAHWNRTLNNGGVFPGHQVTLLENGGYNKGCETFQVECLEIGQE